MGLRVDIGCGNAKRPGFIGLDYEDCGQEIIRDITKGLPFADNTVSEINISHVLEHVHGGEDMFFLISEMYRVCHDGAMIHIVVPHADTVFAHDPAHVSSWNENSFRYFFSLEQESLAVPSKYKWSFTRMSMERCEWQLKVELRADKVVSSMLDGAKTSIIMVAWNHLEETKRAIESFTYWNSGADFELIVVNNASGDGTTEYLDEMHGKYPWVIPYHSETNLGWIGGINKGMESVGNESEVIIFANNDILITEDGWLQRLLNHFTIEVGAVGPVSNYVMGRQSVAFNHEGIHEEPTGSLIGFFFAVRRRVIEQIGGLDTRFGIGGGEDHDYSIRIKNAGWEMKIARDVYIHHTGSRSFKPMLGGEKEYDAYWKKKDKEVIKKWGRANYDGMFTGNPYVACLIPFRTDYNHRLFTMRLSLMKKPWRWAMVDSPGGIIHDSRNDLLRHAKYDLKADYALFLDDDHVLPTDLFIRLFNANVPIIGALAFKKKEPYEPTMYKFEFNKDNGLNMAVAMVDIVKTGIRRVNAIGFHAVLIRLDVLDRMPEPWFDLVDFGEDLKFCWNARKAKIPIYCDTDLINPHIGPNGIVGYEQFLDSKNKGLFEAGPTMTIEKHNSEGMEIVRVPR